LNLDGYWTNQVMIVVRPDVAGYGFWAMVNGVESGSWYACPEVNIGMDVWNTIKVIVNNDTGDYHIFINGQYIQTHNNTSFSSGKIGLNFYDSTLAGSGAIDYVKVSPVNKSVMDNIDIKRVTDLPAGSSVPVK